MHDTVNRELLVVIKAGAWNSNSLRANFEEWKVEHGLDDLVFDGWRGVQGIDHVYKIFYTVQNPTSNAPEFREILKRMDEIERSIIDQVDGAISEIKDKIEELEGMI